MSKTNLPLIPGKLYKSLSILSGYSLNETYKMLDMPEFMLVSIGPTPGYRTKFDLTILVGKQTYNITLWEASIDKYIRRIL